MSPFTNGQRRSTGVGDRTALLRCWMIVLWTPTTIALALLTLALLVAIAYLAVDVERT